MTKRGKRSVVSGTGAARQLNLKQAFAMAVQQFRAGGLNEADAACRKILAADPINLQAMHLRGIIAFQAGRSDEALEFLRRVVAFNPKDATIESDMGMILHAQEQFFEAEKHLVKALKIAPKFASAHLNIGNVYVSLGYLRKAEEHFRLAIQYEPKLASAYNNLSEALAKAGKAEEALLFARKLIKLAPNAAVAYMREGGALGRLGQGPEAIKAFEKAIALKPDDIKNRMSYARSLASYGRIDDAIREYRDVVKADPDNASAYASLTVLVTYSEYDDEVRAMEGLTAREDLADPDRILLGFALGRVFENIGDYERAFSHFLQANELKRKNVIHLEEQTDALFADLKSSFTADLFKKFTDAGIADATPIFVIGMPRSGTTLVEQILSSHPKIAGAGEVAQLRHLVDQLCDGQGAHDFGQLFEKIDSDHLTALATAYVANLRSYAPEALYIVDKMPANFLFVGLIAMIMPNAKIVHCRRDAADTCLSIYKTQFSQGSLSFAYDMAELGHYYQHYRDIMAYWHDVLPAGTIYNIDYENLVADQRGETEKLLAYCGLGWSDECLEFFNTDRAVHTASVAQVRQPIYSKSVGLSQKYGARIKPLLDAISG